MPLPPIVTPSPYSDIEKATTALLLRTSSPLLVTGSNMLILFAFTMIAWHGIMMMFDRSRQAPDIAALVRLVLLIAFGFSMLSYYDAPLPGLNFSFPGLIVGQADSVAHLIEATSVQAVYGELDRIFHSLQRPSPLALAGIFNYFLLIIGLAFAKWALLAVTAFGLVATGVAVLLGPLFIPFLLLPHFEWMFWSWLKCLLQFSFYRVVAQAFAWLLGSFVMGFFQQFPNGLNVGQQLLYLSHCLMLLGAFAFGLLLVPAFTSALFSGRSGLNVLPERIWH